jgi:alpha-tubulin suppressor-like RCC1 family protein
MASFTVSVAQNRWYFHHESSSQFGAFSESLGYADATFVSAPVAPTIAVQPTAVSVIAGESALFSVSASGTGPLSYQWLKNGSPVGGATTNSYAIGATSLADAGNYSVVITNASGSVTSSVAALMVAAIDADLFKIVRLTASNAVVMDPILAAGDDRGGLVATDERVFLRGDDSVGGFDLGLSGGVRLGTNNGANTNFFQYDSLVSDLRAQKAYVLADGAGALGVSGGTVTRLIEIHGSNGVPTGTVITLGTPIAMPGAGLYTANVGIFSGWGRIVLHNGTNAYSINMANGAVTDLGAMARPTRAVSESWAYWGVAEYFGGSHYIVYARDAQSIVRTRIPDGATTVISTFSNLNDLASFTVVPGLNRWYFHNETVNQFTNYANFGGEILGYADAAFLYQAAGTVALTLATNSVAVLEDSGGHTQSGFVTTAPGGTASYALVNDNAGLFAAAPVLSPAGVLTFTSLANANGTANVTITALNGSGQPVGSGSFIITVTAVNDAPGVALATNHVVVLEDSGSTTNSGFAVFTSGPANESGQGVLAVTVTNDNNVLFSVQPVISVAGALTFTLAANAFGSATVTAIAQDNGGTLNGGVDTSAAQSFTITVTAVNDAPAVSFRTNSVVVLEDCGAVSVNGFAAFSPGPANEAAQTLTGYTVANNNGALFSVPPTLAANGTLTFTPAPNAHGSATVTVIAQDNGGTTGGGVDRSTNTFTLTVVAVNDSPGVAFATNSVAVLEDNGAQTNLAFATFLTGPANEAQTITNVIILAVTNSALFSAGPVIGTDGALVFTPAANANGTALVTFSVQDDGGTAGGGLDTSTVAAFLITVSPVNDAPTVAFTTNNIVVLEDSGAQTNLAFAAFSPGPANESGQVVTNVATSNDNSALFAVQPAVGTNGSLTFTPAANANGSATVTVIAQDDGGTASGGVDRTTNTFTITVTAVNDAPIVTFATNLVTVLEDSGAASIPGFASFSPGPANESGQTLMAYAVVNNNGALFSSPPSISATGTLTFTPAPDATGSATITVVVQDNGGTADGGVDGTTNSFTITIGAVNAPPQVLFFAGQVTVLEDTGAASLAAFASLIPGPLNESGQRLTNIVVTAGDPGLFGEPPALSTNGALTFRPATNASGSTLVTVVVQDDGGTANGGVDKATNTFTITVIAVNDAPVITFATNNVVVLEDSGLTSLAGFASAVAGPTNENQLLTFYTVSNDNSALFSVQPVISMLGMLTFTPASNANGTATVSVIQQDNGDTANGGVGRATNTFTITVMPVNDAPSFVLNPPPGPMRAHSIIGWGDNLYGQATQPAGLTNAVAVSAGNFHSLALRSDGTVTAWGYNGSGQVNVPAGLSNVVAIAAGAFHSLALKSDGTLAAWGGTALPTGLTNQIIKLAAGELGSAVVLADGRVFSWGSDGNGAVVAGVSNAVAVAAGFSFGLALRSDGTVTGFGNAPVIPAGLSNVVAIAAGSSHALALKANGTMVIWGADSYGALNMPAGLSNVVAISAAGSANLALRGDGTVVSWGFNGQGQTNVPAGLTNVSAIACGRYFQLALCQTNVTNVTGEISVGEDSGSYSMAGFATNLLTGPADESGQVVSFLVTNNNTSIFAAQPAVSSGGTLTFTTATNANGTATVTVRAQDDGGTANGGVDTSAPQTFTITITPVNDPPVVTFTTNYVVVLEDSGAASFADFASFSPGPADESGQTLVSYTVSVDNPVIFSVQPAISATGTLTFTPGVHAFQEALVTVIAQDSGGTANSGINRTTNVFAIGVRDVNDPPQVTLVTNLVVVPQDNGAYSNGAFATFNAGPTNELGQFVTNVTMLGVANPALFSVQPVLGTNGALTFTPASGVAGSSTVTFAAQDNGGTDNGGTDKTTNTFTITVAPPNAAPVVTLSTNQVAVLEDSGAASVSGFASFSPGPAGDAGQTLVGYTVANNNSALFSVQPAINNAGTLTFTPALNANGSATVTVIAQDNGGTASGGVDRVTNTFQLTITAVNDAPSFALANVSPLTAVVAWGYNGSGGTNVPAGLAGVIAIEGGAEHSLAVLANGTVMGWGLNTSNQASPPVGLSGVTAVAAGTYHSLALKNDGTVVAWGSNHRGQSAVPAGLIGVVAISAGGDHSVALKADGTVVTWGSNTYGESTVPAGLTNVVVIVAGETHTAALKSDGTIVVWGYGSNGEKNLPVGLTNIATIASGGHHLLALRSNGTVVAWGYNSVGQATVPAGLTNVVAISGGLGHSSVLKSDGTVVVFGANNVGQKNVPAGLAGVVMIAAGSAHTLVVTGSLGVQITVAEDSGPYTQTGFATNVLAGPVDESGQTVTFLVSNNNSSLFSTPPAISVDGTLTFTPAGNVSGAATVTVRASDNGGTANGGVDHSAPQTFTLVITAVNDAPSVAFSTNNVVVLEDSGAASCASFVSFTSGPATESGQTLVGYAVSNDATTLFSVQPAISASGTLTFTPATNANGVATVTVVAQDNGGTGGGGVDRATNTFTITVTAVNDTPRVTFALNPAIAVSDSGATNFPGFATVSAGPADEAGQTVAVVSVTQDNPTLFAVGGQPALSAAGELSFQPAVGAVGTATVTVVVQDGGGTANGGQDRATNTFTILVAATRVFVGAVPDSVPNGMLIVPVNLVGVGTESGAAFTLNFDPAVFTFGGVALGGGAGGASLLTNSSQTGSGRLGVLVKLPAGSAFAAGTNELVLVTLNVAGNAPATNSPLTFGSTPVAREVTDLAAGIVPFVAYVGGTAQVVTAFTTVEGDVSPRPGGNGTVTVSDVVQVGRYAAGLDTVTNFGAGSEFQRADCAPFAAQGDGRISLADWVQASRFAAGLDTPGTPGGPTTQTAALRTTTALPAGTRTVRVVSSSLFAGRANTVTVQFDSQGNEAGLSLSLNFDASALAFVSATTGSGASGGSLVVNSVKAAAGKVGLVLMMPAGSSLATGTRDLVTLTFNVTGSGATAISVTGDSPVAREVADVNANVLGASFVGGSFNIILPAGLKAAGMERAADGSLRLVVCNSDGTPVTVAQAAKYEVHVTSNLGGAWTVLPNALVLENGALKIVDPAASNAGLRLYKLVETP